MMAQLPAFSRGNERNLPMKALWLCCSVVSALLCHPIHAGAHSVDELKAVFEQTPIPEELIEATKELNATAGMKSIREEAHEKQHALLEQYIRARTDRKCRESLANISEIDQEIVDVRHQGSPEIEWKLRQLRDATAAFVATKCAAISADKVPNAQP
jgi:hypothetical protein